MKSTYLLKFAAIYILLGLVACKPNITVPEPVKGSADFSRYIALGNSLTAGFSDGGLYLEGQQNSYPELIAAQLKTVGGGAFSTPLFPADKANGSGYLKLTGFNPNGTPVIAKETNNLAVRGQVTVPGIGNVVLYSKYSGDINNYGVPGIKLVHAFAANYGAANGYYERLLPGEYGTDATAYINFATAKPYTFFSLWLGNNDILGYASAGAASDAPTPKAVFSNEYNNVVTKLVSQGAKGVVATIPDVATTPYFRTVTVQTLLAAIRATPGGAAVNDIYIQTGSGTVRSATMNDLFTLPLSSDNVLGVPNSAMIPYGLHPLNPVESKYVLDKDEAVIVADYIAAYNASIKSIAAANGLAVMDANAVLKEYSAGKSVNGATINAAFITGNLFSLDGIHLTPMGYALTANAFISAINAKYGSSIPTVDVTKYRGVKFP